MLTTQDDQNIRGISSQLSFKTHAPGPVLALVMLFRALYFLISYSFSCLLDTTASALLVSSAHPRITGGDMAALTVSRGYLVFDLANHELITFVLYVRLVFSYEQPS